ncbi:spore germination protein [Alkalihalobacillus sp. AL-G]|uniref:spore germination protein n=1 Tax=Alkalihalobacillus sp. AL-G TaxID=2926399 RepID=UPI00272D4AE4|nr:spore germination protein [Alkalihalobacillus sp. AL-G]WLD93639.1 spore germination protein [Alkalihalobacillus sp. AL-G]
MKKWWQKRSRPNKQKEPQSLSALLEDVKNSKDFVHYKISNDHGDVWLSYIKTLVDTKTLQLSILPAIQHVKKQSLEDIKGQIPIGHVTVTDDITEIKNKILGGHVIVRLNEHSNLCLLINALAKSGREIAAPEIEFSVLGPKEAFVESIDTNIQLVRKRLPSTRFTVKEMKVGTTSQTRVAVLYVEGIANTENVNTVLQRIEDIDFDQITDSSFITQLISDNQNSPFPQLIDTERPDRVAAVLGEGKIAIIVDGGPQVLIGPTNLVEFFSAFEDYFLNWHIATTFRLIRMGSVWFSIFATPLYVAILTFHYELIPKDLLSTLVTSRSAIPFPPILEALILELAIELLREAGARLPTKVGQTIGIVGGIVIGTASVEAGLTSNVLLIIVALAALASFTTPVYKMGNTIRLIRFPFLLFAQLWGLLGIMLCFCFLLVHLLRLDSLGRPYLEPLFPPRVPDLKDTIIRMPFSTQSLRPINLQPESTERFKKKKAKKKKDIDE